MKGNGKYSKYDLELQEIDITEPEKKTAYWRDINAQTPVSYTHLLALNQSFYQYNPSIGDGKLTFGSKPSGLANPDLKDVYKRQVHYSWYRIQNRNRGY